MSKKIKKLTDLEANALHAVLLNGVPEELLEDDKKRLKAFYRAIKKLNQINFDYDWC